MNERRREEETKIKGRREERGRAENVAGKERKGCR